MAMSLSLALVMAPVKELLDLLAAARSEGGHRLEAITARTKRKRVK